MENMDPLTIIGTVPSTHSENDGHLVAGNMHGVISNVPQVVNTTVPQVWYNCSTDGVGQLVGQHIQLDITNPELARQFTQEVSTPYGNVHVQIQTNPNQVIDMKPDLQQLQAIDDVKPGKSKGRHGAERVPCPLCHKTVSCNATLRDHMRTHTGERPFPCSECGMSFAQRSNLRMHKRLHTGERPYMCGICGKTFARSSHLPAHMRTHTGEKPYVCSECNHGFITAQQLKNHARVHTGEKPWRCDQCAAAFTHSSSLSTHKKKHTGLKPYKCEKCSKSFFFSSALDKHKKVHSKVCPYKCDDCDKSFKYKESLTVHKDRYCGKESVKKPRGPRKPDAVKPGPKPGAGRKYVQKRPRRPRGRPRKRGRWSTRVRKTPNYLAMENYSEEDDPEQSDLELEPLHQIFKVEKDDNEIPTAELKVEVVTQESLQNSDPSASYLSQIAPGGIIHVPQDGTPMDGATAVTLVSADGTDEQSGAGMQLITLANGLPLQLVQNEETELQISSQYLSTREGIQVWCQRGSFES